MNLIIGLGNPGETYRMNRHNAGFLFIDWLMDDFALTMFHSAAWQAKHITVHHGEQAVLYLKPSVFMNNSGTTVARVCQSKGIAGEDVIIVHDDVDISLGSYKVQKGRGAAGHRGVLSIQEKLGTKEMTRFRLGVGRSSEGVSTESHVLNDFEGGEYERLEETFLTAREKIFSLLKDGSSLE